MRRRATTALYLAASLWSVGASAQGACVPSESTACLLGGRFQVEVTWDDAANPCAIPGLPNSGVGGVLTENDTTAVFSFAQPSTADLVIKVLNGCSLNDHFWVLAAAATDSGFAILVTDTETGAAKMYSNPAGQPAHTLTDTSAFATCPAAAAPAAPTGSRHRGDGTAKVLQGACVPSPTTLCLQDGRFQVDVTWHTQAPATGPGMVVPWQSETSGLFWFFSPENWDLLVKVVDGRTVNGAFWVMFAGTTNVEFTLTVTDTESGSSKEYVNPLSHLADAVIDRGGPCQQMAGGIPVLGLAGLTVLILLLAGAGVLALRAR